MSNSISTRERLLLLAMICFLVYQSVAAVLGILFFLLIRTKRVPTWSLVLTSCLFVIIILIHSFLVHKDPLFVTYSTFTNNVLFWKLIFKKGFYLASYFEMFNCWDSLLALTPLFTTTLYLTERSTDSPHRKNMLEIAQNKIARESSIPPYKIEKILKTAINKKFDGVLLGASLKTGELVVLPDKYVNQIVLVLGTTGAGKTVTLHRFIQRAIDKGYPLIIIDGKPTENNVKVVKMLSLENDRVFYGFNCGSFDNYNPLSHGGYTEIKDKIITLKDLWDNEYYKSVAADYLQTAIEILIRTDSQLSLRLIADCLDLDHLALLVRKHNDPELTNKLKALQYYDRKALTGLQAHLNMLANSELGKHLKTDGAFTLHQVICENAVAYFSLPALRYSDFSKVLGKLIINDIKTAIEPLSGSQPVFIIIDEFSVFAGDQVLNLVNMGRGKGVHAVLGTQGLADLKRVDRDFESQLLNCINTVICHRLNHQESAETIAKWIGTRDTYDLTSQINLKQGGTSLGSARKNKCFIYHPDDIKQSLGTGEAILASKAKGFMVDSIKILYKI